MKTVLALLLFAVSVSTQIAKKDVVILKFPEDAATFEKFKMWAAKMQYVATISSVNGAVAINGDEHWSSKQFPDLTEFSVRDIQMNTKKPSEVYLVSTKDWMKQIKILIPPTMDIQQTLGSLLFKGNASGLLTSDYWTGLERSLGPQIFKDKLASIPFAKQRELNKWAEYDIQAFSTDDFKGKSYFVGRVATSVVYNTNQLNQAERAARQTEAAIKKLRDLHKILGPNDGFDGVKIIANIYYRDFVTEADTDHTEHFEMYVPNDLLDKFVAADITNQDLVDGSTVLVDGSRVKVNLTNFS